MRDNEAQFVEKTREVTIMGGVLESDDQSEWLVPDSAHNNQFDIEASKYFYRRCQELGVRLNIVSRFAAYACAIEVRAACLP